MNNVSDNNLINIVASEYNVSDKTFLTRIVEKFKKIEEKLDIVDEFIKEYHSDKEKMKEFIEYWNKEFKELDRSIQNK